MTPRRLAEARLKAAALRLREARGRGEKEMAARLYQEAVRPVVSRILDDISNHRRAARMAVHATRHERALRLPADPRPLVRRYRLAR